MSVHKFNKQPIWLPKEETGQNTRKFMDVVEQKYGLKLSK